MVHTFAYISKFKQIQKESFKIINMKTILAGIILCIATLTATSQTTCPKWGPYVGTNNMKKESGVLMMADVMFPSNGIAPYTYACSIQFGIGKSGGYCGIQQAGLNEKRKGNNIFSIWDFPNKIQIVAGYKDKETYVSGFGGEGTGLHSHNDFGWLPDRWYTNIVRCWNNGLDTLTRVGYWMYDHAQNKWKHYVTFDIPETNAKLHGDIGSFLENFADQKKRTRVGNYKSYWMLKENGEWLHPDTLVASAGTGSWLAKKLGDDGVQLSSCGTQTGPDKYKFAVKMPAKPTIISTPAIYDLGAYYSKNAHTVHVTWTITDEQMPQLGYKVALYNNAACTGTPLAESYGIDPQLTMVDLHVQGIELKNQNYYVTLQITDIFNQVSPVKIFELHDLRP